MTGDTNSSSSPSSFEQEKRRKLHKKLKKKSEKKSKKHKKEKKKRTRREEASAHTESTLFDERKTRITKSIDLPRKESLIYANDSTETFGPVLPPHLLHKLQPIVIGPSLPEKTLESQDPHIPKQQIIQNNSSSESGNDDMQGAYGPLPITNEYEMTAAQIKLEQRALEIKMTAIDSANAKTDNQKVREEWMLKLPDIGLKSGLAALNNLKRGFHQGREKPNFSDRSSWTKTPQMGEDKYKPSTSKSSKEELEYRAQALYEKQRDAEQEAIAKKLKKKNKREESLVEIHQKKLRKEEKKKAKRLKGSGAKLERRPFTRDVDLKLNQIDRNQTKRIVDKAKVLNSKFSSGHSKYL